MLTLIFLHFLGDWPLQSRFLSEKKCETWEGMAIHCLIYGALFYLVPQSPFFHQIIPILGVMAAHAVIDHYGACKIRLTLWQDQVLHLFILFVAWAIISWR